MLQREQGEGQEELHSDDVSGQEGKQDLSLRHVHEHEKQADCESS